MQTKQSANNTVEKFY